MKAIALLAPCLLLTEVQAAYKLVKDYSGPQFFDDWNFYGFWDNLTSGDVNYLTQADSITQRLAYVNDAGNAIMKVDNTTNVPKNEKRNSIRIESKDSYPLGSVWIVDAVHIPYGCSVWPAFWTKGANIEWPLGGEIDIIEAVNQMNHNQYALHATAGCEKGDAPDQVGSTIGKDCTIGSGCVVAETKPNSYGSGFAQAGGGVTATQFDVSGVYMWFWSRKDVPKSIVQSGSATTMDLSDWGPPSAAYPATACNISQLFTAQTLVFDITLCGVWAGVPSIYKSSCGDGICYDDNVVGAGSPKYDNAYFEIPFVRAYVAEDQTTTSSSPSTTLGTPTSAPGTVVVTSISTAVSNPTSLSGVKDNSALLVREWGSVSVVPLVFGMFVLFSHLF